MRANDQLVLDFNEIDETQLALVGGKGASLARLSRLGGVAVPPGFVVSTEAFREAVGADPRLARLLDELAGLGPQERGAIAERSAALRQLVRQTAIPASVVEAVTEALARLGSAPVAVRSSATAEDSAATSFAGQHDSHLNVTGAEAVLEHMRLCWASVFTEAAVTYRLRNGLELRAVDMAVVVQEMVAADAAGVLFTADPVTGNRTVVSIEAVAGLGEALVAGQVTPESFTVRAGVVERAGADGPVLSDDQAVTLAALGRSIEASFGEPQDIEWCLAGDAFAIVQARPITTLYPVPEAGDDARHVYVSVAHQQMMTDPMKPLGLSVFQLTAVPRMYEAGSRLFVDVADRLASPSMRDAVVRALGQSDPRIGNALQSILDRGFIPTIEEVAVGAPAGHPAAGGGPEPEPLPTDPAIVEELVARTSASIAKLERDIVGVSGPALFDFILADIQTMKRATFDPRNLQAIMAGMEATWWLNEHLETWLGEVNAADTLVQSVPGNVTSEMGLALLDVADAVRPHPEVVAFLGEVDGDDFLGDLRRLPGGEEAHAAITAYLDAYGMRCVGEIDITRPRWSEQPSALVPSILGNVRNFEPGEGPRRFEQGRLEAEAMARDVVERLRALPDDGETKAEEAREQIDRLRTFSGYREFPKLGIVSRYAIWKRALMQEVDELVGRGVIRSTEDALFLRFEELSGAVRGEPVDLELIDARTEAFRVHGALSPPRVLTSEGETIAGEHVGRGELPEGALVGLPVSRGTVEGRARVVLDLADAVLEPGDILVTAFTDPSWTPVFVTVAGLVTEVGGLMTHGAVVAREYGLPAVVGVEGATQCIADGQRIRVHGTDGFVEVLG
ncbi:MAG: phosphoenolpyruvate synthase [Solirubrobacteraceae bacterium]|nr:phosphoenolpyruvate synthase [Solirubrobacteraceae bacterium]